ncbi:MAG: PAS domain-containing protein [Lachnospiraceae bacterium]|nr:PAS domain-containing protein [Lachnospiraceae bacterium]
MNNLPKRADDILNFQINGFHQYIFDGTAHLTFVSKNFESLTGFKEDELLDESRDLYSLLVHPEDLKTYSTLIKNACASETTESVKYHLIKKDGSIIFVSDTLTSVKAENNTMILSSYLTDISEFEIDNKNLRFLDETSPCGFLKYTCEKNPRVTFVNKQLIDFLRIPDVDSPEFDLPEMYKENIFLFIPPEERRRFSLFLNRVNTAGKPIAGEMSLLRLDGTRIRVFGWVTKHINEDGSEEFQSALMDISDRFEENEIAEANRYIKALSEVYDKIFEFNSLNNTVKCLYCNNSSMFKHFEKISMPLDEALTKFITDSVDKEDSEMVRVFFEDFSTKKFFEPDAKPPTIAYKAISSDNVLRQYNGVFIKVTDSIGYFCCRRIHESLEVSDLKNENLQLKEKMNDLIMKFSDGIAAFEVTPEEEMKPLYASENVCEFFGYTNEEWIPLTRKFTPWKTFVAKSEATNEDFLNFLKNGEAEFTYFDYKAECEKKIRAVCTQKDMYTNSPRYVVLYSVDNDKDNKKEIPENRNVTIRTFGYFDVFVGDKPIAFRNKKSKELLALLIDRRGGFVTSEEAIGFLWEDEPASTLTLSRYRKVALRLKNTLEEYGVSDIVESIDGKRRIVTEKVKCDLFDYLSGKEEYAKDFKGSYLNNYSWAETTLGELINS